MIGQNVLGHFDAFCKQELFNTKTQEQYDTLKAHLLSIRTRLVAHIQSELNETIKLALREIQRPANL